MGIRKIDEGKASTYFFFFFDNQIHIYFEIHVCMLSLDD